MDVIESFMPAYSTPPIELRNQKGLDGSEDDVTEDAARTLFGDVGDDDPESDDEVVLEEDPSDSDLLAQTKDAQDDGAGAEGSSLVVKCTSPLLRYNRVV